MSVILRFSSAFRRIAPECIKVELAQDEADTGSTLACLLLRAGVPLPALDGTADRELSALVVVNGRALQPNERFDAIVHDGDVVWFCLPLSGG